MPRDHRPAPSLRILLAEDDSGQHGALALLLGLVPGFRVIAEVGRGDEVVRTALETRPDIALLEVELPGLNGLDAAAALREEVPECRVVILATSSRPGQLRRALDAGVSGFVVKDGPVDDLARTVRRVLTGEVVIDPALAKGELDGEPQP